MKKQSPPRRWISLAIVALLFFSPAFLQGCDGLISTNESEADNQAAATSKMRHSHLFGNGSEGNAGKVLDRYAEYQTSTEFILGFSDTVLDAQKILDRYSLESGVKVKRLLHKSINGFAMHIDADQLDRLLNIIENDDDIAWMEPDPEFTFAPAGRIWSMEHGGQRLVNSLTKVGGNDSSTNPGDGKGSVDIDIYILDTGINHPDLNIVERIDFTADGQEIDMTKILDRYSDTMDSFSDAVGHGTHVAGIAAAIDDDDDLVGMAPGARLHDFKVLNDQGQGEMSSVIAALDVITARKLLNPDVPMVVNLSLGADVGTTKYNALDEAVLKAIEAEVVVVIAAGNDGIDVSTVTPAHVSEAIIVGASTNAELRDVAITSFSNYGDGVDLYAMGEQVRSLYSNDFTLRVEMDGTSMAAPLVTGAVALYLSKNPTATPHNVERDLLGYADFVKVGKGKNATTFHILNASNF